MTVFAPISNGQEIWEPLTLVRRHRHEYAYAALVLSGGYEECGSRGRFRVGAGEVLLHGAYDAHLNRFATRPTRILNLVLGTFEFPRQSAARVKDADAIARTAERDSRAAVLELREHLVEFSQTGADWPDRLASDLLDDPQLRLARWARAHALSAETLSRGFRKVFGISPATFRAEARARVAVRSIAEGSAPLACVAAETGFADQAHLSHATRALTGQPPGQWRKSILFKTAGTRTA